MSREVTVLSVVAILCGVLVAVASLAYRRITPPEERSPLWSLALAGSVIVTVGVVILLAVGASRGA